MLLRFLELFINIFCECYFFFFELKSFEFIIISKRHLINFIFTKKKFNFKLFLFLCINKIIHVRKTFFFKNFLILFQVSNFILKIRA